MEFGIFSVYLPCCSVLVKYEIVAEILQRFSYQNVSDQLFWPYQTKIDEIDCNMCIILHIKVVYVVNSLKAV